MGSENENIEGELGAVPPTSKSSHQISKLEDIFADYRDMGAVPIIPLTKAALVASTVPLESYEYSALLSYTTIRIIDLEPAKYFTDVLRCRLETVELNQAQGSYDALSYVWGQAQLSNCLYVECESQAEDTFLRITPNLAAALRRLRSTFKRRRLWADGICIDQENSTEKAYQVSIMAQIYQSARWVCVHLGHGLPELELCADFITLLFKQTLERGLINSYSVSENSSMIQEALMVTFGRNDFRPVCAFLNLPWFKRRWVIQEAICRVAVVFIYGSRVFSQAELGITARILSNNTIAKDAGSLESLQSLALMKRLQFLITDQRAFVASGILHLLVRCHALECSDNRDRIYSLLQCARDVHGSLIDCSEKPIQIRSNYDCATKQLYVDLAKGCIQGHTVLDVLNCAGAFKMSSSQALRLPSWVPHWDGLLRYKPLLLGVPKFTAGLFHTGGLVDRPQIDGNSLLHITGRHIDAIESFTCHLLADPDDVESVWEYVRAFTRFFLFDRDYITSASKQTAVARLPAFALSLTGDCAFLPDSDFGDDWHVDETREFISETMEILRGQMVSGFDKLINITNPREEFENMQALNAKIPRAREYAAMVCRTMSGRAFFITRNGHIGIGPDDIETGDHVVVLHGGRTPYILRPDELRGEFWIIGDAYVDGFMDGKAADLPKESEREFLIC